MTYQVTNSDALDSNYQFDTHHFSNKSMELISVLQEYNRLTKRIYTTFPFPPTVTSVNACEFIASENDKRLLAINSRNELIRKHSELLLACQNYQNMSKEVMKLQMSKSKHEETIKEGFYIDRLRYPDDYHHGFYLAAYMISVHITCATLMFVFCIPLIVIACCIIAVLLGVGAIIQHDQISSSKKSLESKSSAINAELSQLGKSISELNVKIDVAHQASNDVSSAPIVTGALFNKTGVPTDLDSALANEAVMGIKL